MMRGRDRRARTGADEAATAAARDPRLFAALIDAMRSTDQVLALRSAEAADRASAANPGLLEPHKRELLGRVAQIDREEIRWHVAQMLPRLRFSGDEREQAVTLVVTWLQGRDGGGILHANGFESLAVLAGDDPGLLDTVKPILERHASEGPPAVRARARAVLAGLE
jgi:hypothetical protein